MSDEIIEELWRIKDSIAREHGHDVRALVAYLQSQKQAEHDRTVDPGAVTEMSETDKPAKPEPERLS